MKKLFTIFLLVIFIFNSALLLNGQHSHHNAKNNKNQHKPEKDQDSSYTICPVGKMKIPKGKGITFVYKNNEFTVGSKGCEGEIRKNFVKYEKYGKEIKKHTELICPVTKTKIEKGSGNAFVFKNKEFVVCCEGCINEIKENFAKYERFGKDKN